MRKINIMFLFLILIALSSCDSLIFSPLRYEGGDLHLLVASRESILGAQGYFDDEIVVIEEDHFGRILYGFLGGTILNDDKILAVGVIQTFSESEVYYYDGINMISKPFIKSKDMGDLLVSDIHSAFSVDDIESLKKSNDWGLPLKPEYYFSTNIEKTKPNPINSIILAKIYISISSKLNYSDCLFFVKDSNGLMLYVMQEYEEGVYGDVFLVMINKNNEIVPNTGIYKLSAEQVENPWEILYQFKVDNGWKFH